jgi:hypothetical protein
MWVGMPMGFSTNKAIASTKKINNIIYSQSNIFINNFKSSRLYKYFSIM